jgi:ATP-dependent Clp protease ATP-binding subunit ClpX
MRYDFIRDKLEERDLIEFGFIPEFIGRVPIVAVLEALSEDELMETLTKPHHALVKQYQSLLHFYNVKLHISE